MLNVAITGGRGFIGSHLVESLKSQKGIKITILNRKKEDLFNIDSLKNFVKNKDFIFHLAGINRGTDYEIIAGSVVTTHNLIEAVKKFKSKARIIYLSSIQAELNNIYGLSKRLAEIEIESSGIKASVFRITNVYGEGGRPFYNSVISTFCYQIANGKDLTVNPNSKKFSFIYVGDLIKLFLKEISLKRKKAFYFKKVVSKDEITIPKLAKLIESFRKKPILKTAFDKKLYKTYLSYHGV
jgi:UDP-2-acetamido-2,6-beta-L-arabino-hexul-4-ose reductase